MRTVTALMMTRLMQHLTTRMTRTGSPWSGRRRILKMPSRTSLTNITRTTQRSWTVDSGYMFLNIAFTLSSHRIDDFLLIILSFLYADIYLISSARNKYIILSNILLFPPLCWHPPKQGRGWLYSSREHNIHIFPYLCQRVHFNTSTSMKLVSGSIWTFLKRENIYGAKHYVSVWLDLWQQSPILWLVLV